MLNSDVVAPVQYYELSEGEAVVHDVAVQTMDTIPRCGNPSLGELAAYAHTVHDKLGLVLRGLLLLARACDAHAGRVLEESGSDGRGTESGHSDCSGEETRGGDGKPMDIAMDGNGKEPTGITQDDSGEEPINIAQGGFGEKPNPSCRRNMASRPRTSHRRIAAGSPGTSRRMIMAGSPQTATARSPGTAPEDYGEEPRDIALERQVLIYARSDAAWHCRRGLVLAYDNPAEVLLEDGSVHYFFEADVRDDHEWRA